MRLISLSDIVISPDRQRKEFIEADLVELAESIEQMGLFHPIVVREQDGQTVLVAGERRLRAVSDMYDLGRTFKHDNQPVELGKIPCVSLGELGELEREEAELEENIKRVNLTWQERAAATARLTALRGKQHIRDGLPAPTVAAIATEIRGSSEGVNQETTRREIIVARHLADPEVRAAKNVNEAFKVLKRKEENKRNVQLAAEVGKTFSGASHTLLNDDTLGWLERAPEGVFDVILTDPPYGMGADEFGDSGGKAAGAHGYEDSQEVFETCLAAAVLHFGRICKAQAHLYWFCDIDKFHVSRTAFEAAGWWVHRTPLIWHKMSGSRVPWPEHGPQRKYEILLYAVKGKKPVTHIYPDMISCQADDNLGHGAQKPVALYQNLLQRSVRPGDQVLDCFGGTGTILVAAHELKCKATYIEKDPASYAIAVKRMEALTAQTELPLP